MRDALHANTSMLGKLVWALLQDPGKLWVRVLTPKYLGDVSVLEAKSDQSSSPFWKGLLKARDPLTEGFSFNLGNSISSLWFADWSGYGALRQHTPFIHISDSVLTLADMIVDDQWNVSRLCTAIPEAFLQRL